MRGIILTSIVILLAISPVAAQENKDAFDFGNDSFRAGGTVVFDAPGTDDLFMTGETVRGEADIAGSAHLAGRKVTMAGAVGGDAYLAGMDVTLEGQVAGDATLAGYDVRVGDVGGDLRISGAKLAVRGTVSGYALIAGDEVQIDAIIAGDVNLTARDLDFTDDARIEGQLTIYEEEPGKLEIPASVVPEDRIERRKISEWEEGSRHLKVWDWRSAVGKFLVGVIVVALLASLIAAIVPQTLAEMRRGVLDRPFRNLWFGFLTQSAVVGSAILFAMTVVGLVLSPAAVLLALIGGFAGYVVAVYAFGVGLMLAFGRPEPDSIGERALAAGIGALVAGIIALIPLLGWLFLLALVFSGIGAITMRLFRPGFFVPT